MKKRIRGYVYSQKADRWYRIKDISTFELKQADGRRYATTGQIEFEWDDFCIAFNIPGEVE